MIVLLSDYETYSLFSRQMFNVIRHYTPQVEECSIDEAFADITGIRRALRTSYKTIAEKIQNEIERNQWKHKNVTGKVLTEGIR